MIEKKAACIMSVDITAFKPPLVVYIITIDQNNINKGILFKPRLIRNLFEAMIWATRIINREIIDQLEAIFFNFIEP